MVSSSVAHQIGLTVPPFLYRHVNARLTPPGDATGLLFRQDTVTPGGIADRQKCVLGSRHYVIDDDPWFCTAAQIFQSPATRLFVLTKEIAGLCVGLMAIVLK